MKFYLAGVFDGEGYISIHRKVTQKGYIGYSLLAGVNMVDKEPPELFHKYFGGGLHLRISKDSSTRPDWRWRVDGKLAYNFIKSIKPYLRVKKIKADLGMEFQETKKHYNWKPAKEKQDEVNAYLKMKQLNRRGIYAL